VLLALAILLAFLVLPTPWGIGLVIAAALFEGVEIAFWRRTIGMRVRTGREELVGMEAEVVEALRPRGRVRLRGELWKARSSEPASVGETVVVTAVKGLEVEVEPASAAEQSA
jgi:membrane-bound serine protease (ClpP class)